MKFIYIFLSALIVSNMSIQAANHKHQKAHHKPAHNVKAKKAIHKAVLVKAIKIKASKIKAVKMAQAHKKNMLHHAKQHNNARKKAKNHGQKVHKVFHAPAIAPVHHTHIHPAPYVQPTQHVPTHHLLAPIQHVPAHIPVAAPAYMPLHPVHATHDFIALPGKLQGINNVTIHHIRATQQTGNQCGSRAVTNALAIQDLLNTGQALTPTNIRAQARNYDHILMNHALSGAEIVNLAQDNHLMHCCLMARNPQGPEPYDMCLIDNQAESTGHIMGNMRKQHTLNAPIIFNVGGHWVLIYVMKRPGQLLNIIYMDSGNNALQNNDQATLAISHLAQIIA